MTKTDLAPQHRLGGLGRPCYNTTLLVVRSIVIAVCLSVSLSMSADRLPAADPQGPHVPLRFTVDASMLGQHVTRPDMFATLPDPADFGLERISAFEENYDFVYLSGTSRQVAAGTPGRAATEPVQTAPVLRRRILILKPTLVVIDDQVRADTEIIWGITCPFPLDTSKRHLADASGEGRFYCRSLIPPGVLWNAAEKDGQKRLAFHRVAAQERSRKESGVRLLHVMSFGRHERASIPECSVDRQKGELLLQVAVPDALTAAERVVELKLPPGETAGTIKISGRDGFEEVAPRRLPDGILPLGEHGVALRTQWDLPYRHQGMATWDTGRASSELRRLVESGRIEPCRTVEFGCGTGNDAIYLAKSGFDVTAIDISPTALEIAERKAREAGVQVRWLFADVLRPPELEPFDFVYDRGCYHEVRRHAAAEYVAGLRDLTRSGSLVLILAGNAKKDTYWRFHGPPRVTDAEIRNDFKRGFRLRHLREFRFDPVPQEREGPLAWSLLLERMADDSR